MRFGISLLKFILGKVVFSGLIDLGSFFFEKSQFGSAWTFIKTICPQKNVGWWLGLCHEFMGGWDIYFSNQYVLLRVLL